MDHGARSEGRIEKGCEVSGDQPGQLAVREGQAAVFAAPGSMLGAPAITLPVLNDSGLPLGLQLLGFAELDAMLFAAACGVMEVMQEQEG